MNIKSIIKYVLMGLVVAYCAVLGIRFLSGWSSPYETQEKIDRAIRYDRSQHVFFEDRSELWAYVEEYGYIKSGDEAYTELVDSVYDEGYDQGHEEGYLQGYRDGYKDGASGAEEWDP